MTLKVLRRSLAATLASLPAVTALGHLAVAGASPAPTTSVPAASIQQKCSNVKIWLVGIDPGPQSGGRFYLVFMKAATGWVASLGLKPQPPGILGVEPAGPIGTADIVVKGTSFYAHDVNSSATQTYGANVTYKGTLAPDCTIGEGYYNEGSSVFHRMTPLGAWSGGTFTATPQDVQPATVSSVSPSAGPSTGGTSVRVTGWGFGVPGSSLRVDFCPVGVVANSMAVIDSKCAQSTTVSVHSEYLITATVPPAPAGVMSNCSPQGLCTAQLSVGVGLFVAENGVTSSHLASNVVPFTYRKAS